MLLYKTRFWSFYFFIPGYLLREIKKANIAVPEAEVLPAAPAPKNVLEIMVSVETLLSTALSDKVPDRPSLWSYIQTEMKMGITHKSMSLCLRSKGSFDQGPREEKSLDCSCIQLLYVYIRRNGHMLCGLG